MEIIWTETAIKSIEENISYLDKNWSELVVIDFLNEVERKLIFIVENPNIGQYDVKWKCNKFLIVQQITLYYLVEEKRIILLSFWNNRKEPKY